MTAATYSEPTSFEELHARITSMKPPTKRQWALWIGGIVVGVLLIISMLITIVVNSRIDAHTSQAPAQYQQLHKDLIKLQALTQQQNSVDSKQYDKIQAAYKTVEAQVKQLCYSVPNCAL